MATSLPTPPAALHADSEQASHPDSHHYALIAEAIRYLRRHAREQPELDRLAAHIGLSPHHLQRVFSDWVGISPKRFLQYLTKDYARARLREADDVLSATLSAGLSSPGRLHDLMVACEAMTPGDVRAGGRGLLIRYGVALSPFGLMQVAVTARGICDARFVEARSCEPTALAEAEQALQSEWPQAQWQRDDGVAADTVGRLFAGAGADREAAGSLSGGAGQRQALHLFLRGTNFQIKVWEALLRIPEGELRSYGQLAREIGAPGAARAVGSAVGANRLAALIPCHRVIRESGDTGDYRWGAERKAALLGWEASHRQGGVEV